MVNDVIGGHVTSKLLKNLCKIFLFSSKNIRQHFFVKYVKTEHSFGPNGRKNHKIYRRVTFKLLFQVTAEIYSMNYNLVWCKKIEKKQNFVTAAGQ